MRPQLRFHHSNLRDIHLEGGLPQVIEQRPRDPVLIDFNLSLCHTRAHLLRVVYEGVAFNTRWLLKYVEKFTRRKLPSIRMIGGGAVSRAWCQIHADMCDRIMEQVEDPLMSNLRGAAFIASVSLGFINFEDIPRCVRISRVFEPQGKTRDLYDRLFEEYLALIRAAPSVFPASLKRGYTGRRSSRKWKS
jgi:xylulokinase